MEGLEKILRMKPIVLPRYLFNYYLRLGITPSTLVNTSSFVFIS